MKTNTLPHFMRRSRILLGIIIFTIALVAFLRFGIPFISENVGECHSEIFFEGQARFLGIDIGRDSYSEVKSILGEPKGKASILGKYRQWSYEAFIVLFEYDSVLSVNVTNKKYMITFSEMFGRYGCPDMIYAIDAQEEATGNYYGTQFIYFRNGISFYFEELPVRTSTKTTAIKYYQQFSDAESFLEKWGSSYDSTNTAKSISWGDATAK